jgi:hypothetical protein
MDLLCDQNIPGSLVGALQAERAFDVEDARNVLPACPSNSQKSQYAVQHGRVLLTDDHIFLQNSTNHGVILYADPKLKDSRAVRLIRQIKSNRSHRSNATITASIP